MVNTIKIHEQERMFLFKCNTAELALKFENQMQIYLFINLSIKSGCTLI